MGGLRPAPSGSLIVVPATINDADAIAALHENPDVFCQLHAEERSRVSSACHNVFAGLRAARGGRRRAPQAPAGTDGFTSPFNGVEVCAHEAHMQLFRTVSVEDGGGSRHDGRTSAIAMLDAEPRRP